MNLTRNEASQVKFFTDLKSAAEYLQITLPNSLYEVEKIYPVFLNSYYLDLIDKENFLNDPIFKQCMPAIEECADATSNFDPLAEQSQMAAPRLIHRFYDRVVLLSTSDCVLRCRFCFRKRLWKSGECLHAISDDELDQAIDYLKANPQINEVLLSGGDPLTLPIAKLENILRRLSALEQITVIRIGTRVPVTLPLAVDDNLADMIGSFDKVWLLTHFNHPREVTLEAAECCRKFIKRGIMILNQTVLLASINDDEEVLETLFRRLIAIKVKPHYLFHVDPVRGVRHFATGIDRGLDMLRYFRSRLSSLAVPTFAIDLPYGGGKVSLQPDYKIDGRYPDIHNKKLIDYPG